MNLAELRTMVRGFINEPDPASTGSTGFWTNPEINTHVNVANGKCASLHSSIGGAFPSLVYVDFNTTAPTSASPGGFSGYALPSDATEVVRVERLSSNLAAPVRLEELKFPGYEAYPNSPPLSQSLGTPTHFFIRKAQIDLAPTPDGIYPIRLWLNTRKITLSEDTDTPSFPAEYHDMIAVYAGILCLIKASLMPGTASVSSRLAEMYRMREGDFLSSYGFGQGASSSLDVIRGLNGY